MRRFFAVLGAGLGCLYGTAFADPRECQITPPPLASFVDDGRSAEPPAAPPTVSQPAPDPVTELDPPPAPDAVEHGAAEPETAVLDRFRGWVGRLTRLTSTSDRVVGGRRACQGDWPYLAALRRVEPGSKTGYYCGATVISPQWALTAAHCVSGATRGARGWSTPGSGPIELTLGVVDITKDNQGETFLATDIISHPGYVAYNPQTGESELNDIALIKLDRPWTGPVAALSAHERTDADRASGRAFTAGFGLTEDPGNQQGDPRRSFSRSSDGSTILVGSRYMLQTMVPLVSPETCRARFRAYDEVTKVCAGFRHGGRDSCSGDSGGPLVTLAQDGTPYQIGVVSYGWGCAQANSYGIYTRVSAHQNFIRQYVPDVQFTTAPPESDQQRLLAIHNGLMERMVGSDVEMSLTLLTGPNFLENDLLELEVASDHDGDLLILDISAGGKVTQLFPNPYMAPEQTAAINAGQPVRLPSPQFGAFKMPASADPPGEGRLVAFLIPRAVNLPPALRPEAGQGLRPNSDSSAYIMDLLDLIDHYAVTSPVNGEVRVGSGWGAASATYTISK